MTRKQPNDSVKNTPAEIEKRLRNAEFLLEIYDRISIPNTLDGVLRILMEMTSARLNAERSTFFLNDPDTNELYSRVAQGNYELDIRIPNSTGIAGHVFTTARTLIVNKPYDDPRFNRSVDDSTGFITKNILCSPILTANGDILGVAECLNKRNSGFTKRDISLFEAMVGRGALAVQSALFIERLQKLQKQEMEFIDMVSEISADIKIKSLLRRVMEEARRMLNAERSTLFLNDESNNELWSEVSQGNEEEMHIRMPNDIGIAGTVFQSNKAINIPYAYADLRFNPEFDRKTGFFTRSILCVPLVNKTGKTIGVTQVLNKRGGPFTGEDEAKLRAFTAQVSIALENAKLFADIQSMKNYNEAMLESMSNGLITFDETEKIVTCNTAGLRILNITPQQILNRSASDFFSGTNAWVADKLKSAHDTQQANILVDASLEANGRMLSVNLTVQPLLNADRKRIGSMLVMEDITSEKRIKSTMSRYMDPNIADRLVAQGAEILGGQNVECTVLFSDIRGFTTISEQLGAQATVALLNEYFTLMVDCLQKEGGMLDKFIGDAMMAVFGIPEARNDDADRAMRTAIAMINELMKWNKLRINEGKSPMNIGIGLNTDSVVSGNIGSEKRMDFTVIGDGVNLASRLESACKQYGVRILISEFTYQKLKDTYRSREIDRVVVKGKTLPVAIYEILDYHTEISFPHIVEVLSHFRDGLDDYRNRKWDAAAAQFQMALSLNPSDRPSEIYLQRCASFKMNPPPEGWNGANILESK